MTTSADITTGIESLRRWLDVWQLQLAAGPLEPPDSIDDLVEFGLTRDSAEAYARDFDAEHQAKVHEELRVRVVALRFLLACFDDATVVADEPAEVGS